MRTFAARRALLTQYRAWGTAGRDRERPLLWVHAPSVGEGLMALPVIQRVRREAPDAQLAYTFFSPSAARFAEQVEADFTAYLPFDTTGSASVAITSLAPTAIVFSKLDVWPLLVETAHARGVRLGLMSASIPEQSARHGLGALLTHDAYTALDWIGAASQEDANRLLLAGGRADCVQVTGDTRYDQAWERAHQAPSRPPIVATLQSDRPTLVAGSTWPADERPLLAAWRRVIQHVPGARLIIAPHEPSEGHLRPIEAWAKGAKIHAARLSSAESSAADVVLVDRVGVLADLYAVGDVAYVGGGFHASGLHSIVEPAVLRKPVVIGPRHHASRDARLMLDSGGAISVQGIDEIAATLQRLLSDAAGRERMACALDVVVADQRGAVGRSVSAVLQLLSGKGDKAPLT